MAIENQWNGIQQDQLDASTACLEDTWSNSGLVALDRRNAPPEQPPEEPDEIPGPTPEQLQTMHAQAALGRLDNDTARGEAARAAGSGGPEGLVEFSNAMNTQLAAAGSDYRSRVVRGNAPNGVIHLYLVLQNQTNNENPTAMVRNLNSNGANSPYRDRVIPLRLVPQVLPDV